MLNGIKITLLAVLIALSSIAEARTERSPAAKAEFKRMQPCPVTDRARGRCPGYEIDHRIPLKCGGPDAPSNMQWLSVEEHKAKTAREARWCRSR